MTYGINRHAVLPYLPAQATDLKPSTGCAGCPLSQAAGHVTCSSFSMSQSPTVEDSDRLKIKDLEIIYNGLQRRINDAIGIIGAQNSATYRLSANHEEAINFSEFKVFKILSVNNNQITLFDEDGDAKRKQAKKWREKDKVVNMFWVVGFEQYTAVQVGDVVHFDYPSKLNNRVTATVHKVISATDDTLVLELDKDVSGATTKFFLNDEDPNDYPDVFCKVYSYAVPFKYKHLIKPNYFYGIKKEIEINSVDLAGDKILKLEDDNIATPATADALKFNFVVQAFDGINYIDISQAEIKNRLHIKNDGSFFCFGSAKPVDSVNVNIIDDLSLIYTKFKITYYKKVNPTDQSACKVVSYDRCLNSIQIPDGLIDYDNDYGVGIADDKYNFCQKRNYEEYTYVDDFNKSINPPEASPPAPFDGIPDRVTIEIKQPEYIDFYPDDGNCVAYNYCSKYQDTLEHLDSPIAPTNMDYLGKHLVDILYACDARKQQKAILQQEPLGWELIREKHPSLFYLNGYYNGLTSPNGWHPSQQWFGEGSFAKSIVYTDDDGNESLVPVFGVEKAHEANAYDQIDYDYEKSARYPQDVDGYKTKRNNLDYDDTITDDLINKVACLVQKDTGKVSGRGVVNAPQALESMDIVIPNINLNDNNLQDFTGHSFIKNLDGSATIKIKPIRQDQKSEKIIATRIIDKITKINDLEYDIEFRNERQSWSKLNMGTEEIGDSFDEIFTAEVGNGAGFQAKEFQQIDSFHNEKKYTGSRHASIWQGDTIRFDDFAFVIKEAEAYGGSEALTWGNEFVILKAITGGFLELDFLDIDQNLVSVDLTSVYNDTDSTIMTPAQGADKYVLLENTYYYDGNKRIYFSSENVGDVIEVNATINIAGLPANFITQYHTVSSITSNKFDIAMTKYNSAILKKVFIGTQELTLAGSSAVTSGQYYADDDGSGKLEVFTNIDDSSPDSELIIQLEFDSPAPAPSGDWAVALKGFLSYAKKKDRVRILVDSDYFDTTNQVGKSVELVQTAGVFIPKLRNTYTLDFTPYQSDNYQTINSNDYIVNAGNGTITLLPSFFDNYTITQICNYGHGYHDPAGQGYNDDYDYFTVFGDEPYLTQYGYGYGCLNYFTTPQLCFKLNNINLISHLASLEFDVLDNIKKMERELNTITQPMGGASALFSYTQSVEAEYVIETDSNTGCTTGDLITNFYTKSQSNNGLQNRFSIGQTAMHMGVLWQDYVFLELLSGGFTLPEFLKNAPDSLVIKSAKAELYGENVDIHHNYGEFTYPGITGWDENNVNSTIANFSVFGFINKNDIEFIGNVSSPDVTKRKVYDVTDIIQAMFTNRKKYMGFGLLFSPVGLDGLDLETYMPDPTELVFIPDDSACGGYHAAKSYNYYTAYWDNIQFGNVEITFEYPLEELEKTIIIPRLPSMKDY